MSSIEEQRRKLQELQEQATVSSANGEYGRNALYETRIYSGTGHTNGSHTNGNGTLGATQTRLSDVLDKFELDTPLTTDPLAVDPPPADPLTTDTPRTNGLHRGSEYANEHYSNREHYVPNGHMPMNGESSAYNNADSYAAAAYESATSPASSARELAIGDDASADPSTHTSFTGAAPRIGTTTKGTIAEQWTTPKNPGSTVESNGHGSFAQPSTDSGFANDNFDNLSLADQSSASPLSANQTDQGEINIKGRADGISIEIGRGSWNHLLVQLTQRLEQAAGFFRGGQVLLDVGPRPLTEAELQQTSELLTRFGMKLSVIRSSSEQTGQLALAMGLASSTDGADGVDARPAESNHETLTHFVYRGNLRSGQVLERNETVIVMGDVNPGAHVISAGDVLIWGRLRGIAHAGATGDVNAVIAALAMNATQLRIADQITALPPDRHEGGSRWLGKKSRPRAEIAYLNGDQVTIEEWDETKLGGIMAFRK